MDRAQARRQHVHRQSRRKAIAAGSTVLVVGALGALAITTPASAAPRVNPASLACRSCVGQGITAIDQTHAWLVGFRGGPGSSSTWVRQWNGKHWHNSATPNPGTSNEVFGVDGASPNDVWSVGWYSQLHSAQSLIMHWDGSAWTQVQPPLAVSAPLYDISAASANDIWAVGYYLSDQGQRTLILHYNGSTWSQVPSPNPAGATNITLRKVSADSAGDAWALGQYRVAPGGKGLRSYMLHWNGASWSEVPTVTQNLQDVSASSPSDAWAVGADSGSTVTEHWNGASWSRVASPNPGPGPGRVLTSIDDRTSSDVWAAGFYDTSDFGDAAFILHWNGSSWTDAGAVAPTNSYLYGISADAPNDAFAFGDTTGSGKAHLLLEHWDGTVWNEQ